MAFSDEGDCSTIETRRPRSSQRGVSSAYGSQQPNAAVNDVRKHAIIGNPDFNTPIFPRSHLQSLDIRQGGCNSAEDHIEVIYNLLSNLLQKLEHQRSMERYDKGFDQRDSTHHLNKPVNSGTDGTLVVNEVTEMVDLQDSMAMVGGESSDSSGFLSVDDEDLPLLSEAVQEQLRLFVAEIAGMYHTKNPFHCFEHASHVTCSAYQLVRHVVANDLPESPVEGDLMADPWSQLPSVSKESTRGTNGLRSDALAQFAIVFSALIHDVDHVGVPNTQLAKEKPAVAAKYENRSLAEQTSVNMAWDLLSQGTFRALQACIFPSRKDYVRFRSMVINIVMSTDIADATLRQFLELKWEKAFGNKSMHQTMEARVKPSKEESKRRATVMMDLIMMASDISHTMQPFEVYCEWNERLFREVTFAYREGRSEKDPSGGWYKGEMFFYDKHIIPLARRLQETGMFGTAADAMLATAQSNRDMWEQRGEQILADMQSRLQEPSKVSTPNNEPARETPETISFVNGLISMCCRGALPKYFQANLGSEQDEYYEDDGDEGRSDNEKKTLIGDDDTWAETETDEDERLESAEQERPYRPNDRGGWTSFYLRSRAKKS